MLSSGQNDHCKCAGCCGFWCLPCLACSTMEKFGECTCLPLVDLVGPVCSGLFRIPVFAGYPAALSLRVAMRYKYGIQGTLCQDVALSCFCSSCSWCQMAREIQAQKRLPVNQSVTFVQPSEVPSSQVFISNQNVVPGPQSVNMKPNLPGLTAEQKSVISYPAMASAKHPLLSQDQRPSCPDGC